MKTLWKVCMLLLVCWAAPAVAQTAKQVVLPDAGGKFWSYCRMPAENSCCMTAGWHAVPARLARMATALPHNPSSKKGG